jgi:Na+-driven multidrug efflux pump
VFFRGDFLASLFTEDPRVIARAFEYLKGFMPETVVTAFLFSFIGYYNGHEKTAFVMFQGIAQTCLVRVPVSYFMSIRPNPSLTQIGLAAPLATVFGIFINLCYFWKHFAGAKAEKNKKTTAALPEN